MIRSFGDGLLKIAFGLGYTKNDENLKK